MLLSSLTLLFLPIIAAATGEPDAKSCLPSGDERPINEAFSKGGGGTVVELCPGSVHKLNSPIFFTAEHQTLSTQGHPLGIDRAMLIVQGKDQAAAIRADCQQCSHAIIRSLIVDGNRPQLLRVPKGDALIEIGNAESQTVRDCRLYEPRGWSALHFREGDRKQCTGGLVKNNEIGPAGEEWDDEYDGVDEKGTPYGNPRADGISLACKDSRVEKNVVYDTTDGAIVLFGSAGSEVRNNEIYSKTRVVLGGINLVDYDPWNGDYMGVTVHHNHLHAYGRYFKVGIVVGPSSWSDDTDSTVHSASITENTFDGDHFGYGIVVSSATSFTVQKNIIDPANGAKFDGVKGPRCPKAPENGKPTAFLINRGSAKGSFQDDFVNGEVQHIICLNPPDENGVPYQPWRLRDSPEAIAAKAASDAAGPASPEAQAAFDARIAEAVVSYQMNLIQAMDGINHKIERLTHPVTEADLKPPLHEYEHEHEKAKKAKTEVEKVKTSGNRDVDGLSDQIHELELGGKKLKKQLDGIKLDFEGLSSRLKKSVEEHKPIIESVFLQVQSISGAGAGAGYPSYRTHEQERDSDNLGSNLLFGILGAVACSGALVLAATTGLRRWRARRKSHKVF